VWLGTTPLIVVAGLALWVAALDVAEPLGQEVDHPSRTDALPIPRGEVFVRHLPLLAVGSAALGLVAGLVAGAPVGEAVPMDSALVTGLVGGLLAAAGAAVSVVQGAPDPVDQLAVAQPEIAGVRTLYRTAFPPALAVMGITPLLAARAAFEGISEPPPLVAAVTVAVLLSVPLVLVTGWVRFRDQIAASMAAAMDQASPTKTLERQREERLAAQAREAEAAAKPERAPSRPAASPQQRAKMPMGRKRDQT
jgi:hypothetical protein